MLAIELACVAIVGLYLGVRLRRDADPRGFLTRFVLLMAASWLAEDVVIHVYGFYAYSPRWVPLVDQVPLLVAAIWPVVIQSAWDLARRLTTRPARVPLVTAAIVLADASLIEPVAVHAGLWWWTEPGLFRVPPVGILGWAVFTYIAVAVFTRPRLPRWSLLALGPALVHPALLVAWWGALRWVSATIPPWPAVALAWALSLALAVRAWRVRAGARLPIHELLLRVPAAGFFFALLAVSPASQADGAGALTAYALAFAPPYLVLTWQAARDGGA